MQRDENALLALGENSRVPKCGFCQTLRIIAHSIFIHRTIHESSFWEDSDGVIYNFSRTPREVEIETYATLTKNKLFYNSQSLSAPRDAMRRGCDIANFRREPPNRKFGDSQCRTLHGPILHLYRGHPVYFPRNRGTAMIRRYAKVTSLKTRKWI